MTKVHLELLRMACSHTCSLPLKPGRAWLNTGPPHCEKALWYPSCHSECEIQDMTCQDEPLQHIVAMQLSVRYISLQRKAFKLFPWWNEYKCTAPVTFEYVCVCDFFFSTTGRSTLNNREVTLVPLLIFDCWAFSEGTLVQYFSWSIFERGRGCMEARKILNMKHWPSLSLMKAKFLRSPKYFLRCLKKRWFHNADLKELFHISSLILNLF